ncbi:hypothetical protein ACFFSY_33035 [Paenibacillus aurantiacus]|uniref:Uncharacterized protein n=1 Tax=Paenibacillus aurantiacus TaxID=1936118 RepID=A0ABV5L1V3_9BACL
MTKKPETEGMTKELETEGMTKELESEGMTKEPETEGKTKEFDTEDMTAPPVRRSVACDSASRGSNEDRLRSCMEERKIR